MHAFEWLAASRTSEFTLTGVTQARRIAGRRVTAASFFDVLGIRLSAGRGFTAEDDAAGAAPVAIVAESLRRQLGDERAGLVETLDLDGLGLHCRRHLAARL